MKLTSPSGCGTRPITDRAKESLFNTLIHRYGTPGGLPPIEVLDLFAGSGSLGLEALSRGARFCTFVERAPAALRILRHNIQATGLNSQALVVRGNAWTMRLPAERERDGFGLVFVDPPYRQSQAPLMLVDLLCRLGRRLTPDGTLVFRHGPGTEVDYERLDGLSLIRTRRFGTTSLLLFGVEPSESDV